jgi:hypothetical protein
VSRAQVRERPGAGAEKLDAKIKTLDYIHQKSHKNESRRNRNSTENRVVTDGANRGVQS